MRSANTGLMKCVKSGKRSQKISDNQALFFHHQNFLLFFRIYSLLLKFAYSLFSIHLIALFAAGRIFSSSCYATRIILASVIVTWHTICLFIQGAHKKKKTHGTKAADKWKSLQIYSVDYKLYYRVATGVCLYMVCLCVCALNTGRLKYLFCFSCKRRKKKPKKKTDDDDGGAACSWTNLFMK